MTAPRPIATILVRPQQALVTMCNANLAPGHYNCYSEAQINELLRRIAELEGVKK